MATGFEPVVPTVPRRGQYVAAVAYTETEGGGDIRVELTQCPDCLAAVAENVLNEHRGKHEAAPPDIEEGPK